MQMGNRIYLVKRGEFYFTFRIGHKDLWTNTKQDAKTMNFKDAHKLASKYSDGKVIMKGGKEYVR